ncbi:tryptophan--tRNA ligase, cytoplasmic-like isoform X2 [Mercenaria mercenaria]|uniref:tryptophan--tRNA ligase, cytoplasmic-like isoform X2 n=1 Tax=Mercenaria mercenaria TaxID=6596 RepID=UPI001E1DA8DC|nr:tryptophan--tRNA ligase, cytoplasmic-like isoform X2 [Mercenaria mercenaria]
MAADGNVRFKPVEESCSSEDETDKVTPFIAKSKSKRGFKYEKLIKNEIDDNLRSKIEEIGRKNGKPVNHFLKRGIFFSHRWLQEAFDVPLVIQMSDDEKYFSEDLQNGEEPVSIETIREQTRENVKDIIALGFDVNKTFIFSNFEYMCPEYYKNICRVQRLIKLSRMKIVFDFDDNGNIGKINFPAIQAAPCFSSSFPHIFHGKRDVPCLVPCAIDQDCYFDLMREIAIKLDCKKPALIHSKFVPSLVGGVRYKMSASKPGSILLTDTNEEIETKINEYNADPIPERGSRDNRSKKSDVDVIYHYLYYFMKSDEFDTLKTKYDNDEIQSDDLKSELIKILKTIIGEIRQRRKQVTDEMVKRFMTPRPLNYKYKHGSNEIL